MKNLLSKIKLPNLAMLFNFGQAQTVEAKREIKFRWRRPVTDERDDIVAYCIYRSGYENYYKALRVGMTTRTSFTDRKPLEGNNYYFIVPVGHSGEWPAIDITTPGYEAIQMSRLNLFRAIDEILWMDWDANHVRGRFPAARDEYRDYVPVILELKMRNADIDTIAQKLKALDGGVNSRMPYDQVMLVATKIWQL